MRVFEVLTRCNHTQQRAYSRTLRVEVVEAVEAANAWHRRPSDDAIGFPDEAAGLIVAEAGLGRGVVTS